jgi:predicted acyl esterase
VKLVKYTGFVPSFDGLPLDVDVTMPRCEGDTCGPLPLVVFFHGWALDKNNWESDTVASSNPIHDRWNNVAFAARGYVALNYSIRGWRGSCGPDRAKSRLLPETMPPECKSREYWVHVADPRFEIRDAQYLIGRLVDDGFVDPNRIGVTGGSYGGAHAWWLALLRDRVVNAKGEEEPWQSPRGTLLHIAASAPMYTWATLTGALLPNGRAHDAAPNASARTPIGVPLGSYLRGFFAGGPLMANAFYAPAGRDPSADFTLWFARFEAGAPFVDDAKIDPLLVRALDELDKRSPLFAKPHGTVPIFQVQGFTDPLFAASHATLMLEKMRAVARDYPMTTFFGDVGHDNASNPAAAWSEIHDAGIAFFDRILKDAPAPATPPPAVTAFTTACVDGQKTRAIRGDSFASLAHGVRTFESTDSRTTTHLSMGLSGVETDPLLHKGCIELSAKHPIGTSWTFTPKSAFTIVGAPKVTLTARFVGADATLAARIFDVHGDRETLVTRGAYRYLSEPGLANELRTHEVTFELPANAWEVQPGHAIRLEIVGNGAPEMAASLLPFTVTISRVALTLPTELP